MLKSSLKSPDPRSENRLSVLAQVHDQSPVVRFAPESYQTPDKRFRSTFGVNQKMKTTLKPAHDPNTAEKLMEVIVEENNEKR